MSEILTCERSEADAEIFISLIAYESTQGVVQEIPSEYRSAYLSTYAAGLLLDTIAQKGGALHV